MDLLFKRYASPFSFMEGWLHSGRFSEFVDFVVTTHNEERKDEVNWSFYLHKVQNPEMSYQDFVNELETNDQLQNMTDDDKASALQSAFEILGNFNPLNEKGE